MFFLDLITRWFWAKRLWKCGHQRMLFWFSFLFFSLFHHGTWGRTTVLTSIFWPLLNQQGANRAGENLSYRCVWVQKKTRRGESRKCGNHHISTASGEAEGRKKSLLACRTLNCSSYCNGIWVHFSAFCWTCWDHFQLQIHKIVWLVYL